nr:MAG TPA: hypothetical protein [Caudoviricetes sp.]
MYPLYSDIFSPPPILILAWVVCGNQILWKQVKRNEKEAG